ncbi:MAG TPA: hypothetical protein VE572_01015 [Nitrososphaeraceae archaeon]|nr:hypothetical protein [Nitrososphaeraceae archaeon]
MRLPFKDDDHFANEINRVFGIVKDAYLSSIRPQLEVRKVDAMLGDGSVIQVDSFEPQKVSQFYQQLIFSIKSWATTGISRSKTEDLHRIYCQFTKQVGKYKLLGYFGIQYHAFPYYRVDKRVIEIQRELVRLAGEAEQAFMSLAATGNSIIQKELRSIGLAEMGFQELLEKLFEDQALTADLQRKVSAVERDFPEFQEMNNKKEQMLAELNGLLMELCQVSPVLIDHNKLMQGEEGVTTFFDIERVKNQKTNETDSYINTKRISKEFTEQVVSMFSEVAESLKAVGNGIKLSK